MISQRELSPEFAWLWGELRCILETVSISLDRVTSKHKQGQKRRMNNKDAQLKWFVHWRGFCAESGLSPRQANAKFINAMAKIEKRVIDPPVGFKREWFLEILHAQPQKGLARSRTSSLTELFRREAKTERGQRLLSSEPEESPAIPPVNPAAYQE